MPTNLRSTAPVSMVVELPATWIQIFRVPPPPEPRGDTPCRRAAVGAPQATGLGSGRPPRWCCGGPWSGRGRGGYTAARWTHRSTWPYTYTSADSGGWWRVWPDPPRSPWQPGHCSVQSSTGKAGDDRWWWLPPQTDLGPNLSTEMTSCLLA